MAELLICVIDQTSPDLYQNCKLPKRGDVILAAGDDHCWNNNEQYNEHWRILSLPGEMCGPLAVLCCPELNTVPPPYGPSRTLQYRAQFIDLDELQDIQLHRFLQNNHRQAKKYVLLDGINVLWGSVKKRQSVVDPFIIVHTPYVIG